MHETRADQANLDVCAPSSLCENNERQPPLPRPSNGAELPLGLGVIDVREDDDGAGEHALDLGDRNSMALAIVLVGFVLIRAGEFPLLNEE